MLKCASLFTYEIDDPEAAFEGIKAQIDEKISLLKHSIGIIMCHPEFIHSGTAKYICEKLPFDVVGGTTSAQATNGEFAELILTIFVMTSDDVWFKTGITGCLEETIDEPVKTAFERAIEGSSALPALAIIFLPLIMKYSGDPYVTAIQKVLPKMPIFGSIAIDDTLSYEAARTIYNGENHKTAMSFVLCYGNIHPRFIVGTFPDDKVMSFKKGEVTKSSGSLVYEINNISAYKYFQNIGFLGKDGFAQSFNLVPFVVEQRKRADYDGIPVIRGLAAFNEAGVAVFRGDIAEGSTFAIAISEPDDVLSETRKKLEEMNNLSDINGALIFSCLGRRIMIMHLSPILELENAKDTINPGIPFTMGYAGGEVSPTSVRDGIPTNVFHNFSLIILVV